jgi:hypothetical protein
VAGFTAFIGVSGFVGFACEKPFTEEIYLV